MEVLRSRRWAAAGAVGLLLMTAVVVWGGVGPVLDALRRGGWGVLVIVPLYAVPVLLASAAWRVLFPPGRAPRVPVTVHLTWIGIAVNRLLPVAQVGGEVVKVRLLRKRGGDGRTATATVVADKTVQAATQAGYALVGLGLLALTQGSGGLRWGVLGGSLLFGGAVYVFYRLQRRGLFRRISTWIERFVPAADRLGLADDAGGVDRALEALYRDRGRVVGSVLWRTGFRLVLALEVLVVLPLLGEPVGVADALILESLGQAARAAAFAIPAGLGAQEGGFVVAGVAVGLAPETALALSLVKRAREVLVGVPALLAWQAEEGRDVFRGGGD